MKPYGKNRTQADTNHLGKNEKQKGEKKRERQRQKRDIEAREAEDDEADRILERLFGPRCGQELVAAKTPEDYAALRKRLAENIRDENKFLKFGLGVAPVGPLLDFVIAEVTEWEKERDSQPATELSDDEVERELSLISLATGSGD